MTNVNDTLRLSLMIVKYKIKQTHLCLAVRFLLLCNTYLFFEISA